VYLDSTIKLILHDSCQLPITLRLYVDFFCLFLLFCIGRSPAAGKLLNQNNLFLINKRNKTSSDQLYIPNSVNLLKNMHMMQAW